MKKTIHQKINCAGIPFAILWMVAFAAYLAACSTQDTRSDRQPFPFTSYVQIKLNDPISMEDMTQKYKGSLKWMRSRAGKKAGIIRKYSIRSDSGTTIGGIILSDSEAHAKALFPDSALNKLKKKYNSPDVTVVHFLTAPILDNVTGKTTVSDAPHGTLRPPKMFNEDDGRCYTVVVQIPLREPVALDKAITSSLGIAPKYAVKEGLIRKYFLRSTDGQTIGGVYYFQSKEMADNVINDEWTAYVKAKLGVEPKIHRYQTPFVVDNAVDKLYGMSLQ